MEFGLTFRLIRSEMVPVLCGFARFCETLQESSAQNEMQTIRVQAKTDRLRTLQLRRDKQTRVTLPYPNTFIALLKSAIRSSGSSNPTDRRIMPGVMPILRLCSSGMEKWDDVTGWLMVVRRPPSVGA